MRTKPAGQYAACCCARKPRLNEGRTRRRQVYKTTERRAKFVALLGQPRHSRVLPAAACADQSSGACAVELRFPCGMLSVFFDEKSP